MADYQIHIDLRVPLHLLQVSIRHAMEMVNYGLTRSTSEPTFPLPAYFRFSITGIPNSPNAEVENQFRSFLLANGFRDVVEQVQYFLEEARKALVIMSFGGKKMTGEEYNRLVIEQESAFGKKGLPQKMSYLRDEFSLAVDPRMETSLLSINSIRNCYVHRNGIVGSIDARTSGKMWAEWMKLELYSPSPSGDRAMGIGSILQPGESMGVRRIYSEKLFSIGDRVEISIEEFDQICCFICLYAQEVLAATQKYGESKGMKFIAAE